MGSVLNLDRWNMQEEGVRVALGLLACVVCTVLLSPTMMTVVSPI